MHDLVRRWLQADPDAIKRVDELLASVNLSIEHVVAQVAVRELANIESFNRLMASTEWRRNASLHEIERRRASFAQKLRGVIEKIEDAEFNTVEAKRVEANTTQAKPVAAQLVVAKSVEGTPVEAKPIEATPVEATPLAATHVEAALVAAPPVAAMHVEADPYEDGTVEANPYVDGTFEDRTFDDDPFEEDTLENDTAAFNAVALNTKVPLDTANDRTP